MLFANPNLSLVLQDAFATSIKLQIHMVNGN